MATIEQRSNRRGPRTPGLVFTGIAVVLLTTLVAIALTTRQPPPPTIAEFAPQAIEQIKEAPTEQLSEFGSGDGGSGFAGTETRSPESALPKSVIDVPRVRRCVGDPPRQIEDPQSPPCVPYWEGDNGGATHKGVTRDEIRVMIPSPNAVVVYYERWRQFFNKRFEFYGRKLEFIYPSSGDATSGNNNPAVQQADAVRADEEGKVFASNSYRTAQGRYYHEELARRKIVSATGNLLSYEASYYRARRPYIFSYLPEADLIFQNLGEWSCKRIVGKNATYAGDLTLRDRTRTFGIFFQTFFDEDTTTPKPLEVELARCGEKSALTLINPVRTPGGEEQQAQAKDPVSANNAILQMKQENVTSIFCLCQAYAFATLTQAAASQRYSPEWIISSYGTLDLNGAVRYVGAPPDQLAQAFGLSFHPRQLRLEHEPYWWAIRDVDPTYARRDDSNLVGILTTSYRPLLMLASGIQMAGPNLTPETFEKGLQRARFPNPDHPNLAGRVGFLGGRYSMIYEGAEYWWSNTARSPYAETGGGTFCYLNGGARYSQSKWPAGNPSFFREPCDSGA